MWWEGRESEHCCWECEVARPLWKNAWPFCSKLDTELPCESAIPPIGIHPKAWKPSTQTNACLWMFIALLTMPTGGNNPNIQPQMNVVYPYNGVLASSEKEWVLIHATTQMDLEKVLLSKRSQIQRLHFAWLHLCELFRTGQSTETESRSVIARDREGWREEWMLNG